MDMQPIYDDVTRYALNQNGHYVCWSLRPDQVNRWWLAEVNWNNCFTQIQQAAIIREFTSEEYQQWHQLPIFYWGVLYHTQAGGEIVLVRFRWSEFTNTNAYRPTEIDPSKNIGV